MLFRLWVLGVCGLVDHSECGFAKSLVSRWFGVAVHGCELNDENAPFLKPINAQACCVPELTALPERSRLGMWICTHNLNSLKGGYIGDYIGDYYKGY